MTIQIRPITYVCRFCHKVYVREQAYMAHECAQMKKEAELKTPEGQTAWNYYQIWMRYKKRVTTPAANFISSNYFRTFINFVKYSKQMKLPMPEKFIWFAVQKNYQPTMWINDEVYVQYIDFIDSQLDPIEQVTLSAKNLFDYSETQDIDFSEIFDIINPNELLQLIRLRKISPWILLFSKKFINMMNNRMNIEQQKILNSLIDPEVWDDRINNKSFATKNKIKSFVSELGI